MQGEGLISITDRLIHNFYKHACFRCRLPLMRTASDPSAEQIAKLQTTTTFSISNAFEQSFYKERPAFLPIEITEAYLWRLEDVFVTGAAAQPFTRNGRLFSVSYDVRNSGWQSIRRPIPALARRIRTPLLHLSGSNHENRGHFICQFLPRLVVSLPFLKANPQVKVLVAPAEKEWQAEYLRFFDIPTERMVECSFGTCHIDELFYPPMLHGDQFLSSPDYYKEIRDRVRVGIPAHREGSVIFITRNDAPDRRALNEDKFFEILKSHYPDALRVALGNIVLHEQAAYFMGAKLIVGWAGQGSVYTLFAKGATLISLSPSEAFHGWLNACNQLSAISGGRGLWVDVVPRWEGKDFWGDTHEFARVLESLDLSVF